MEKTEVKSLNIAPKFEEFIAYDEKGNPVVLRRTVEHPGVESGAVSAETVGFSQETDSSPASFRHSGSLRFFAGFDEVRARLQGKLAVS